MFASGLGWKWWFFFVLSQVKRYEEEVAPANNNIENSINSFSAYRIATFSRVNINSLVNSL